MCVSVMYIQLREWELQVGQAAPVRGGRARRRSSNIGEGTAQTGSCQRWRRVMGRGRGMKGGARKEVQACANQLMMLGTGVEMKPSLGGELVRIHSGRSSCHRRGRAGKGRAGRALPAGRVTSNCIRAAGLG